ncbi:MAG: hypothetical protein QW304_07560 [Thermoproteota archaeon]
MGGELALGVWIAVAVFMLGGYLFLRKIGAEQPFNAVKKPIRILFAPFYIPKVALAVFFLALGIAFFMAAPYYHTYQIVTGYRYRLELESNVLRYLDSICSATRADLETKMVGQACSFLTRYTLDRAVTSARLVETPVYTGVSQLFLRADFVLLGIAFTLVGLILTAYFLVKANNRLSGQLITHQTVEE